jgi:hypothetical protein
VPSESLRGLSRSPGTRPHSASREIARTVTVIPRYPKPRALDRWSKISPYRKPLPKNPKKTQCFQA